nr:hypothetical protein [uncultured Schaedlerella sp.]
MELIAEFILEIAGDIAEVVLEGHLKKKHVFILFCSCILAVLTAITISLFWEGHYVKGTGLVLFDLLSLYLCLYVWKKRFSSSRSAKKSL